MTISSDYVKLSFPVSTVPESRSSGPAAINLRQSTRLTFYRATHTHIAVYVVARCMSVCPSVTLVYCVETAELIASISKQLSRFSTVNECDRQVILCTIQ